MRRPILVVVSSDNVLSERGYVPRVCASCIGNAEGSGLSPAQQETATHSTVVPIRADNLPQKVDPVALSTRKSDERAVMLP